jgi:hypothetical protein
MIFYFTVPVIDRLSACYAVAWIGRPTAEDILSIIRVLAMFKMSS